MGNGLGFVLKRDDQWINLIRIKYGMESGGWFSKKTRYSYGVGIWKEIMIETVHLKLNSDFEVGKGVE